MSVFRLTSAAALALLRFPAAAARGDDRGVAIVDHGLYRMTAVRQEKAPHHISGERTIVRDIKLIRKTRLVNAQLGRVFGFRFKLTDPALNGRNFTLRLKFPKMTNPRTGKQQATQDDVRQLFVGTVYQQAYGFDYTWEMAEGIWTFQVLHRGRLLTEQKFKVVVTLN